MRLPSRLNNGNFGFRSSKHSNGLARPPAYLFPVICFLALLSLVAVAVFKMEDFAYQTKTVAGHNLDPTPWHIFQPKCQWCMVSLPRPETNVGPWDDEFKDIKKGSESKKWIMRQPFAYWKGNPYVASPMRLELLKCNDTKQWRAQIFNQILKRWLKLKDTAMKGVVKT
ncbi:hypothetical protein V2J09_006974 [Rumex salicifolius]